MKKQLAFMSTAAAILFSGATYSQCNTLFSHDNFNQFSGWTIVDPENNGNGEYSQFVYGFWPNTSGYMRSTNGDNSTCANVQGASCGNDNRAYKAMSGPVSNNSWRADMDFVIQGGNSPSHVLLGLTAGNQNFQGQWAQVPAWACNSANTPSNFTASNQDGIFASLVAFGDDQFPDGYQTDPFPGTGSGWRIYGHAKNDAGAFYNCGNTNFPCHNWSQGILLPSLNTTYYLRLERLNATTCRISVFSDANRTQHVTGSPQCFTIDADIVGLNTKQMGAHPSGSFRRSLTGRYDNIRIYNNCGLDPNFVLNTVVSTQSNTYEVGATPKVSNADITANGGGYYWSVEKVDQAGNVIPGFSMNNPSNWWDNQSTNYFPGYCCNTNVYNPTRGVFYKGEYYRVTRGTWGGCVPWTAVSQTFYYASGQKVPEGGEEIPGFQVISEEQLTELPLAMKTLMQQDYSRQVTVFPNPGAGLFKVEIPLTDTESTPAEVYDINGRKILQTTLERGLNEIDLSGYPKGLYLLKLEINGKQVSKKIQVQ